MASTTENVSEKELIPRNVCKSCGKVTKLRCSGCSLIYICSKLCMKQIWGEHKKSCKKKDKNSAAPIKTKAKLGKGFLNTAEAAKTSFFGGGDDSYCIPCEDESESKGAPFRIDGALVIETIPGASYTDTEFAMLNHAKDMVKSIQRGDLASTGMLANHFLSGKFKQLCDKAYFQATLFPGFSADALESLPQNMRELLLWKNLTVDLTKIARNAARVLISVQQKGEARGDIMDRETKSTLMPQIAQEALAVELEVAVKKVGKEFSKVAARVQLSLADPTAEQASWDQLDEDVWPDLLSSSGKLCYQEEFLGDQWAALIGVDAARYALEERMDDVPTADAADSCDNNKNVTDISGANPLDIATEINAPQVPARFAWLTDEGLKHYPALQEAVQKLRGLPYELNLKQGSHMQLLEPAAGCVALTHYRAFSCQQQRYDNSTAGTDSGIRVTCHYHLVPSAEGEDMHFYHQSREQETEEAIVVEDDGLAIYQSTEVLHRRSPANREYYVLSLYVLAKSEK